MSNPNESQVRDAIAKTEKQLKDAGMASKEAEKKARQLALDNERNRK
jgi:hypothetical protein